MPREEFKVNDTISLKLDNGNVNIYLNGELFRQCKAILLTRQFSELHDLNSIESVDELAETFEHSYINMEGNTTEIPLETQFWAHCSNIQAWIEHDYDT